MATTIEPINQTISTVPALRHRSTVNPTSQADKDDFVVKYEANNDHLANNTVSELNTLKTQINTTTGQINTAVDTVVAKEALVSPHYTAIDSVYSNEANINAVNANKTNINLVASNEANINAVASNEININNVSTNMTKITNLDTNMSDINNIDSNMSDINLVASNEANINLVAINETNINDVATNMTKIIAVNANEANINAVNANATNINLVVSNEANINDVATNMTKITNLDTNMSDINNIDSNMSDINLVSSAIQGGTLPTIINDTSISNSSTWSSSKIDSQINTAVGSIDLSSKQDTLVSGSTIKTVNSSSILGSGDLALLTSTNPVIDGSITEQVYNLTGTEINPSNGTIQYKTISANTTFTETLTAGQSVILRLINANTRTITFPTITWVGKTAPILTANCVIVLWKEQSILYGAYVGSLV